VIGKYNSRGLQDLDIFRIFINTIIDLQDGGDGFL
jgi:hypothetical protein